VAELDAAQKIARLPQLTGSVHPETLANRRNVLEDLICDHSLKSSGADPEFLQATSVLLRDTAEEYEKFRQELQPRPFFLIAFAITVLLAFGLFWPLMLLPGVPGSSTKFWMMIALLVVLLSLSGFFWFQFVELFRLGRIRQLRSTLEEPEVSDFLLLGYDESSLACAQGRCATRLRYAPTGKISSVPRLTPDAYR